VRTKKMRYEDNPAAAFDPHERINDLDREGIRRAVLYPTIGLFINRGRIRDGELVTACCRAYNDWMADYCRACPDRLYGAAAIPLHDVEAAVIELERSVTKLGLRAAFIRPAPYVDERPFDGAQSRAESRPFNDPVYDPFWSAAQELGVPVALHPAVGEDVPGASRAFGLFGEPFDSRRLGEGISFSQGLGNPMDMINCMGWFIYGGVCERFPRLKVAVLESSGGWLQPILERMDHHHRIFAFEHRHLSMKPSDYFRRQMWISFDPDEELLGITAKLVGDDRIIWASDFPHPDARWPGTGDEVRKHVATLPKRSQPRIAGANAVALYGL
jgi:predicted TIM-barrel fold metal-dependent hydrolase